MDAELFLSNTISVLATSADLPTTVDNLARLASAELADGCAVFTFDNEHTVRRLAIASGAESGGSGHPVDALYPLDLHASAGPGHILRTGECERFSPVTPELIQTLGLKSEELKFSGGRRASAYFGMPIIARGRTIGAIAFFSADSKASFDDASLGLMHGLANAAGVAIDNAKLYREAQEANRLKDEFVAMVSHELRTPLTPILGCIHLLRTATLSQANFDRALEMIERHAHVQVQIVEDLLDASRIVAGKLHLVLKSTQIVPVVEAAVASVQASADAKGLHIITNLQESAQPIDGDPHRLQQIVWHLLSNAVKFTPPDGRIEISTQSGGDHVEIRVTDTGVGIPADLLPSIFDRFRQSGEANFKMRSGLGLGLAIVRHLVELHNGSIEAASAGPGQGAVFTLRFPFAARKAASATS
ncbi:MAG TPA: GAF domain-containing sensor histidine kinase [Terriglobia bacterium]|jgi:signal transduction histidine kinase